MKRRYVLAPEAVLDLLEIWKYIKDGANIQIADLDSLLPVTQRFVFVDALTVYANSARMDFARAAMAKASSSLFTLCWSFANSSSVNATSRAFGPRCFSST